jgi:hypothetical protein
MKKTEKPFLIGIDPDTHKSGVAIYNRHTKSLHLFEYELWAVFDIIKQMKDEAIVRLEAGHKEKSTWHKGGNGMAKRVGANNEIGRQIEKFCIENGIVYELVKPCGFSSYNHETFCQLTGWNKKDKTNPEKRVAGLLVYGY